MVELKEVYGTVAIHGTVDVREIGAIAGTVHIEGTPTVSVVGTPSVHGTVGISSGSVSATIVASDIQVPTDIQARYYNPITLFSDQHIGAGSTLTTSWQDVSNYYTKNFGFRIRGQTGSYVIEASYSGTSVIIEYSSGDLTDGGWSIKTTREPFQYMRSKIYCSGTGEGTVDVYLGQQT